MPQPNKQTEGVWEKWHGRTFWANGLCKSQAILIKRVNLFTPKQISGKIRFAESDTIG